MVFENEINYGEKGQNLPPSFSHFHFSLPTRKMAFFPLCHKMSLFHANCPVPTPSASSLYSHASFAPWIPTSLLASTEKQLKRDSAFRQLQRVLLPPCSPARTCILISLISQISAKQVGNGTWNKAWFELNFTGTAPEDFPKLKYYFSKQWKCAILSTGSRTPQVVMFSNSQANTQKSRDNYTDVWYN